MNKKLLWVVLMLTLCLTALAGPALADTDDATAANAPAVHRSIEEFVAVQGTYCFDDGAGGCALFTPPLPNFLGQSDPSRNVAASVDYNGFAETYLAANGGDSLGTNIGGNVIERARPDGRANVHIVLRTRNALTWVVAGADFSAPPLFGNKVDDVLAGAPPALCLSVWDIRIINTAPGAPLPDLLQLLFAPEPGQEMVSVRATCNARGEFHAAYGVPEGTPGRVRITQVLKVVNGEFTFPVERILLIPNP